MLFGNPLEFAIEAYHEPMSPAYSGFGRMALHIAGVTIGDIDEEHCGLAPAAERLLSKASHIRSLWSPIFAGHSDEEIFLLIDRELYVDYGQSQNDIEIGINHYGQFDFLTNAGEQFDDFKTFLYASPEGTAHILYQHRGGAISSALCSIGAFEATVRAFVEWFNLQCNVSFGAA